MLEILLGASGGVFGILGALVKQGIELFQKKQYLANQLAILQEQNRHELLMADKHLDMMKYEAQNELAIAELKMRGELEHARYDAMEKSYEFDKATYSNAPTSGWMVFVDVCRGLIRPLLTIGLSSSLVVFTMYVWRTVPLDVVQNPTFLSSTFYKLVDAFIFLSTTAVGWWFAASASRKL